MVDTLFLERLVETLGRAIPPALRNSQADLERNFRAILQGAFSKLDLVTREEFDAQKGVLLKTRQKLAALEKQLTELEQAQA